MGSSANRNRSLAFFDNANAQSSKAHKNSDIEVQISEIPDSVLSNTLFPEMNHGRNQSFERSLSCNKCRSS
jgi:hypothetical protein